MPADDNVCPPARTNRPDDPEYIVRLVGQVIRVSLETVKLVNPCPPSSGE